jgi:hypothetical protein
MKTNIVKLNGHILSANRLRGYKRTIACVTVDSAHATVQFEEGGSVLQYNVRDTHKLVSFLSITGIPFRDDRDPEGAELAELESARL